MSQFLICKSKENMIKYGLKLKDVFLNKSLYIKVVNKYMLDEEIDNIWVIDNIDDILMSKYDLKLIEEIVQKSELLIFWYGTDFEDLERMNSSQMLISYLESNINDPSLELYLYVDLS